MNESRARGGAGGRVGGLTSIPRQGFNKLVQSCPIVRIVKYYLNIKDDCVETKECCVQNETLIT